MMIDTPVIDMVPSDIEQSLQDRRLAEQEIFHQSIDEKAKKIDELEARVQMLEEMLDRLSAVPRPRVVGTLPTPKGGVPPRRWSVR